MNKALTVTNQRVDDIPLLLAQRLAHGNTTAEQFRQVSTSRIPATRLKPQKNFLLSCSVAQPDNPLLSLSPEQKLEPLHRKSFTI
jgi:hypothetical protein